MQFTQVNKYNSSQSEGTRLAANSLYGIMARVIDFVLRFVMLSWVARYLGSISYGDFALITAMAAFIHVLADFGMEPVIQREINIRPLEKNQLIASTLTLRCILSFVLLVCVGAAAPVFDISFPLRTVIIIESFAQVIVSFQILLLGVLRAHEVTCYDLLTTVTYHAFSMLLVGFVIYFDFGFKWLFVARCMAEIVKLGYMVAIVQRKFVPLSFKWDLRMSNYMLKEGVPILALSLVTVVSLRINVFVLKFFHDSQDVAFFDFPHRIIMAIGMVPLMVVFASFPALCRKAKESQEALTGICVEIFRVLLLISLPVSAALVAGGDWIVSLSAGSEFNCAGITLRILGAALPALFLMPLFNFTLTATGKQQMSVIGSSVGFVVNVGIAVILVPSHGYIGAAVAMALGNLASLTATWALVSWMATKLPPWKLLGRPLAAALPMLGVCLVLQDCGWMGLWGGVAGGGAMYVFLLRRFGVIRTEELLLIAHLLRGKEAPRKVSKLIKP